MSFFRDTGVRLTDHQLPSTHLLTRYHQCQIFVFSSIVVSLLVLIKEHNFMLCALIFVTTRLMLVMVLLLSSKNCTQLHNELFPECNHHCLTMDTNLHNSLSLWAIVYVLLQSFVLIWYNWTSANIFFSSVGLWMLVSILWKLESLK